MNYEQVLQQRLRQMLAAIRTETTSDFLIAEYEKVLRELHRLQDESTFK